MEARLAKLADAKKRLASYKKQTLQRNSAKKLPEDQVNLEQISDPKLIVADIEHHATPIDEMTHGTTKMANPTLIQIREFDQTPQILQIPIDAQFHIMEQNDTRDIELTGQIHELQGHTTILHIPITNDECIIHESEVEKVGSPEDFVSHGETEQSLISQQSSLIQNVQLLHIHDQISSSDTLKKQVDEELESHIQNESLILALEHEKFSALTLETNEIYILKNEIRSLKQNDESKRVEYESMQFALEQERARAFEVEINHSNEICHLQNEISGLNLRQNDEYQKFKALDLENLVMKENANDLKTSLQNEISLKQTICELEERLESTCKQYNIAKHTMEVDFSAQIHEEKQLAVSLQHAQESLELKMNDLRLEWDLEKRGMQEEFDDRMNKQTSLLSSCIQDRQEQIDVLESKDQLALLTIQELINSNQVSAEEFKLMQSCLDKEKDELIQVELYYINENKSLQDKISDSDLRQKNDTEKIEKLESEILQSKDMYELLVMEKEKLLDSLRDKSIKIERLEAEFIEMSMNFKEMQLDLSVSKAELENQTNALSLIESDQEHTMNQYQIILNEKSEHHNQMQISINEQEVLNQEIIKLREHTIQLESCAMQVDSSYSLLSMEKKKLQDDFHDQLEKEEQSISNDRKNNREKIDDLHLQIQKNEDTINDKVNTQLSMQSEIESLQFALEQEKEQVLEVNRYYNEEIIDLRNQIVEIKAQFQHKIEEYELFEKKTYQKADEQSLISTELIKVSEVNKEMSVQIEHLESEINEMRKKLETIESEFKLVNLAYERVKNEKSHLESQFAETVDKNQKLFDSQSRYQNEILGFGTMFDNAMQISKEKQDSLAFEITRLKDLLESSTIEFNTFLEMEKQALQDNFTNQLEMEKDIASKQHNDDCLMVEEIRKQLQEGEFKMIQQSNHLEEVMINNISLQEALECETKRILSTVEYYQEENGLLMKSIEYEKMQQSSTLLEFNDLKQHFDELSRQMEESISMMKNDFDRQTRDQEILKESTQIKVALDMKVIREELDEQEFKANQLSGQLEIAKSDCHTALTSFEKEKELVIKTEKYFEETNRLLLNQIDAAKNLHETTLEELGALRQHCVEVSETNAQMDANISMMRIQLNQQSEDQDKTRLLIERKAAQDILHLQTLLDEKNAESKTLSAKIGALENKSPRTNTSSQRYTEVHLGTRRRHPHSSNVQYPIPYYQSPQLIQQSRDAALIELLKSHLFAAEQFISQQTTETRIMKESLLAITTFIPGNSYDSSLKKAQQQLTELRRVWLQEHENNKSLRLNSFKNQKNFEQQQYEYLELRQEFDKVTSMVEELLDEIEDRECT